jgi:hypothetical protein
MPNTSIPRSSVGSDAPGSIAVKWATRELIHVDRVVSAWAILRFVDAQAEFIFLGVDEPAPPDVTPFGIAGAQLGAHDGESTTFARILKAYSIDDAALVLMNAIVADIVGHVMHDPHRDGLAHRVPEAGGLLAIAEGIMLLSVGDGECLERSLLIYDALYARLQARIAMARTLSPKSASMLQEAMRLSGAVGAMRRAQCHFSAAAFADALNVTQSAQRG